MKTSLRAAAAAALALGLSVPAGSADAGATTWTKLVNLHGAKVQGCKMPTTKHGPWKVKVRVDARKAATAVHGSAEVDKGQRVVDGPWRTHLLQPGTMSKVHTLRVPRGKAFTLQTGLENESTGVAVAQSVSAVGRC